MVKVLGRDAMEWTQPFLQAAVITVDVVDVKIGCFRPGTARLWQNAARDFRLAGEADDRLAAIAAELVFRRDDTAERSRHRGTVAFGQHGIGGLSQPVTRDQHRNLLRGQTSCLRHTAALVRRARQAGALALKRFQDVGLVDFDNPGELARFVERRSRQKPVAPTERGANCDVAALGRFDQALASYQRLRLGGPLLLLSQAGQGRSRQRVEAAPAIDAAVAGQPADMPPPVELLAATMRAARAINPVLARGGQRNRVRNGCCGRGVSRPVRHHRNLAARVVMGQPKDHRR